MMGYVFLGAALFSSTVKGFCGKKISGYTNGFKDAILANVIRMLLCTVIGFVMILTSGDISEFLPSMKTICLSALSGISTAIFVLSWLISIKKSAYMMMDIFLMLGVLVPLIASNLFFNEVIKTTQWLGMGLLIVAVILMCSYNNSIKTKITPSSFMLLLLCGVANGVADFSQKLFMKHTHNDSVALFNFYTYVFATVVLLAFLALTHKTTTAADKIDIKKIFSFILIMAICLFANSYFKTLAAGYLNAVLLYPLNQGCSLILSAVMSAVLFREKLTIKAVIGIITAFIGLLIINLL